MIGIKNYNINEKEIESIEIGEGLLQGYFLNIYLKTNKIIIIENKNFLKIKQYFLSIDKKFKEIL